MGTLTKLAYDVGAGAKLAFYAAHYGVSRAVSAPLAASAEVTQSTARGPIDRKAVRRAFFDVFQQDRSNIATGLYCAPDTANNLALMRRSGAYLRDLDALDQRRLAKAGTQVREDPAGAGFPTYYRQNFHWQSGGWLTDQSADLYDFQVETLFTGSAAAMRRATALALLADSLKGCDQRSLVCADIACGTGQFSQDILRSYPKMRLLACDMSPAYARKAARAVKPWTNATALCGAAEALPFGDGSLDRAVCIYLFHELPPKVRVQVVCEMARVIRRGGVLVLADALQTSDNPNLDVMLDAFPHGFHEPYFTTWLTTDIVALLASQGFQLQATRQAFLTKAWAFVRL